MEREPGGWSRQVAEWTGRCKEKQEDKQTVVSQMDRRAAAWLSPPESSPTL